MTTELSTSESAPALTFADFDTAINPGDDLFRHVNGTWLRTAEIDADKPGAGAFITLRDQAEEAVRDIITGLGGQDGDGVAPGTDAARIADLYASFMDTERIEELGARPLLPWLDQVDRVDSTRALSRLLGTWLGLGVRSVLGIGSDSDPGNPERALLFSGQSGLGLPDESYYREEQHAEIFGAYAEHVERTFALLGAADPAAAAARVVELETALAAVHWDKVRTRDLQQMYNLQTWADFTGAAPGIDWAEFLAGAGIPDSALAEVVNAQPSFVTGLAELVTDDRLEQWRDWARFALVSSLSPYLSEDFVAERFRFYGTVLSGVPTNRERWKRGVALVEGALGEAVGRIYVDHHFTPQAKSRMDELVANLIEAYRQSISDLDWMTEETRAEALLKLSRFTPKIGFPEEWKDYSTLAIDADDLIGNVIASNRFDLDQEIDKALKPVDRNEWFMTPQTVNAYYHPLRNEIVFPAAILQPPFFNDAADDAVNYGAIGAVIGHEIGHGFDDQGSTCDGDGRLRNWWTDADRSAFTERTAKLVDQYAVLSPEGADGQTVNGQLTIGENIGDLGGIGIALKAWRIATAGTEVPEIDGLTGEQRLFLSWGAIWQAKFRPEMVKQRLATDPHSPNEFRCNQIVRNMDAFYDAFGVTPDNQLWLAPEERVAIW
ncbi:M13 family metallopeptidase [Granulicoccus sp. GXG6511]|uniref:M13 family metallopeptidase n=1 Tax=Granulicoccus sp. GXG6511 TaxID=3381351 RepID=UPI003D7EF7CB